MFRQLWPLTILAVSCVYGQRQTFMDDEDIAGSGSRIATMPDTVADGGSAAGITTRVPQDDTETDVQGSATTPLSITTTRYLWSAISVKTAPPYKIVSHSMDPHCVNMFTQDESIHLTCDGVGQFVSACFKETPGCYCVTKYGLRDDRFVYPNCRGSITTTRSTTTTTTTTPRPPVITPGDDTTEKPPTTAMVAVNPEATKQDLSVIVTFMGQPGILAAIIGGAVVGLLCAILLVMFLVYRMRKRDEGSYEISAEPARKPMLPPYSQREIYA